MKLKLTTKQLEELSVEHFLKLDDRELTVVRNSDWTQEHKFQRRKVIFTDGEKHYLGYVSRSGSPFTDWEWAWSSYIYGDQEEVLIEVEKREVVTYEWMPV